MRFTLCILLTFGFIEIFWSSNADRTAISIVSKVFVDTTDNIVEKVVRSKIHCFILCIKEKLCSSIVFVSRNSRCYFLFSQITCFPNDIEVSSVQKNGVDKPVLLLEKPPHMLLTASYLASILGTGKF